MPPAEVLDADEAARYRLVEDDTLSPGSLTMSDGMVASGLWGCIVRAHSSVIRAVRVRWPQISDNAQAFALVLLVEDAE